MRHALLSLALVLALAACAAPVTAPEATQPGAEPMTVATTAPAMPTTDSAIAPTAAAGAFGPLTLADCQKVHDEVQAAVGVRFAGPIDAPFTDDFTGQSGTACTMEADGTGVDFESPGAVMTKVAGALTADGWAQDMNQQADGPTGTTSGFTRGTDSLIASAQWEPAPEANCPPDQPISACPLKPEQQIYQVRLAAMSAGQ